MVLYCCEKCARSAKKNNPSFAIGMPVFFIGDIVECDICGEAKDLYWCEDKEADNDD